MQSAERTYQVCSLIYTSPSQKRTPSSQNELLPTLCRTLFNICTPVPERGTNCDYKMCLQIWLSQLSSGPAFYLCTQKLLHKNDNNNKKRPECQFFNASKQGHSLCKSLRFQIIKLAWYSLENCRYYDCEANVAYEGQKPKFIKSLPSSFILHISSSFPLFNFVAKIQCDQIGLLFKGLCDKFFKQKLPKH